MIYNTIMIFFGKTSREVCVCWDDINSPDVTEGFYLETLGM